jgi:hypothetical protein
MEAAGDSPVAICDSLYQAVDYPSGPELVTDIDSYIAVAASGLYPLDNSPIPDAVCPLSWLISERLYSGRLSLDGDLVHAFAALDLPFVPLLEANLDSDPDLEQVGLIDLSERTVIILDAAGGEWTPSIVGTFRPLVTHFQSEFRDVNNDDQPELLILFTLDNECGSTSDTGVQEHLLFVIGQAEGNVESLQREWICEDEVDLSSLDASEALVSPPFWANLVGEFPWTGVYTWDDNNFYDYLDQLTAEVIYQEKPTEETLRSLNDLLNSLPADNSLSDIIRPHLLFSLGYRYELNGDEVSAVNTYLKLIRQSPRSPWAWLAWLRLEPVSDDD